MTNTRKMVLAALFTCAAMGLYALECTIPPLIMVPGVKLGIANVVTMVAMYTLGRKEAFAILMLRIVMTTLLFGHMMSLTFSLAGGILSYCALCICYKIPGRTQLWATSVIAAFAHNFGQIAVACLITGQMAVAYYFLFLIIASVITGSFNGLCGLYCIRLVEKIK